MWRMPAETAEHTRTRMAFPREGYAVVDPTELERARRMLEPTIELVADREARPPVDVIDDLLHCNRTESIS